MRISSGSIGVAIYMTYLFGEDRVKIIIIHTTILYFQKHVDNTTTVLEVRTVTVGEMYIYKSHISNYNRDRLLKDVMNRVGVAM